MDQTLGEVEVSMELKPDESLSMVVVLANGGRRSFPGTWKLDAETLCSGALISRLTARVELDGVEDSVLVLEDSIGQREEWQRKD